MYIDPNTGGMLFQILAAGFVVISGVILVFSSKIKLLWARITRRKTNVMDVSPEQPEDTDKPA